MPIDVGMAVPDYAFLAIGPGHMQGIVPLWPLSRTQLFS